MLLCALTRPPAPWASVILACCLTQESNTVNYFWTSKHGKISSTWTSGHQIQQFWTKGAVVILGLYGNAGLIILILSFLRQRPKEQPLLLFRGWGRVEVMQRLLALPLILLPFCYWQGIRMVYRSLPPFKAYLLMFWDSYPISRNSRDPISTLNYILSIFGMEWAILMEKAHQSGRD